MALRLTVLSWNLFHGRAVPAAGRELSDEFAARIASWEWDVALLQEVPPWWAPLLARRAGAGEVATLTSRNAALRLRRALAERWPDAIRSNGGGANVILHRRPIAAARDIPLRRWPERRVGQLVQLEGAPAAHLVNVHASARVELAQAEIARLGRVALAWAGEDPLVLGGDLNLRDHELAPTGLASAGFAHVARRDVDHVFARRLRGAGTEVLDSGPLSDHPPLRARLEPEPAAGLETDPGVA